MFIRTKSNKSGSKSIQIVRKDQGRLRIIHHIGTGYTQEKINKLRLIAKQALEQEQLKLFNYKENQAITDSFMQELSVVNTYWIGYEEVFGTVFDKIGFQKILSDKLFRDLVIARIVYPVSKLATHRWLQRKLQTTSNKNQIYLLMDKITSQTERDISDHVYKFVQGLKREKIHIIFFDATTLHFETFKSDNFRKTGFSKVGKHNQPQIVIGLMVTKQGLPIGYDVYPGNQFDGHTIRSALTRVSRRYSVDRVVFVADAAMMSEDNAKMLKNAGFEYIMAAKIKGVDDELKKQILNPDNYKDNIFQANHKDDRLVVSYSESRARKDKQDRENNILTIKKRLASKSKITKTKVGKIGKSKYLKVTGEAKVELDYEAIKKDATWDGLKGYQTNIPKKDLSNNQVIKQYTQLWQVENAFRVTKSELGIRPIYHYKRKRIRAHILLVFVGLVVSRYVELQLKDVGITTKRLLEYLESVQLIEVGHENTPETVFLRQPLGDIMEAVYSKLDITLKRTPR